MFKVVGLAAAAAISAVVALSGAEALPLMKGGIAKSDAVLLVREGCGPGSNIASACGAASSAPRDPW